MNEKVFKTLEFDKILVNLKVMPYPQWEKKKLKI